MLGYRLRYFDTSTLRQAQTFNKCLRVPQAPSGTMRRKLRPSACAFDISTFRHFDKLNATQAQCNVGSNSRFHSGTVRRYRLRHFDISTSSMQRKLNATQAQCSGTPFEYLRQHRHHQVPCGAFLSLLSILPFLSFFIFL
jgi:hypothetical protein